MRTLLTILIAIVSVSQSAAEDPAPKPPLELKIAVPVHHNHRSLNVGDHFHVLVKNVSDQPARLWSDKFSWGYENLSFEQVDADGASTIIKKKPREWRKNFPDWLELKPGDTYVLNVNFSAPDTWENPPKGTGGAKPTLVQLRAVYQVTPDEQSALHGVWTGKLESAVDTYAMW